MRIGRLRRNMIRVWVKLGSYLFYKGLEEKLRKLRRNWLRFRSVVAFSKFLSWNKLCDMERTGWIRFLATLILRW